MSSRFDIGSFRVALGLRGMILTGLGAWVGIGILDKPAATSVAILTGLLLLLASFHGDPRRRLRAYLITAGAGASLVGVGTWAAAWPTAALIAVVAALAAVLTVVRSSGGLLAAAGTTLLADLVVGAASGLQGADGVDTMMAAMVGGCGATLLAFLIAPGPWESPVRRETIDLLTSCAEVLSGAVDSGGLSGSSRHLVAVYLARPERPASPLPSAQASVDLLADLTFLTDVLATESRPPTNPAAAALLAASAECLRQPRAPAAPSRLAACMASLPDPAEPPTFLEHVVITTTRAIGHHTDRLLPGGSRRASSPDSAMWARLRARITLDNPMVRSTAAAALLFGGLVWIAEGLRASHPQWILLVAVSAFYPYARRAAAKASGIVAGTLAGALVFLGLSTVLGPNNSLWWAFLLAAAWGSMSAPHSLGGTVLGQGLFTLLSLSLLTLASSGVQTHAAPERAFDVVVGCAAAVAVALTLAPRDLQGRMRRALADLLATAIDALAEASPSPSANADRLTVATQGQFLRCVDIADVGAGANAPQGEHAVDWLDGARLIAQARSVAAVCRGCDDVPEAAATWQAAIAAFSGQRQALQNDQQFPTVELPPAGDTSPSCRADAGRWLLANADSQVDRLRTLIVQH